MAEKRITIIANVKENIWDCGSFQYQSKSLISGGRSVREGFPLEFVDANQVCFVARKHIDLQPGDATTST